MSAEQSAGTGAGAAAVGPPPELVRSLVDGPSAVTALEWHDELDSTNARALRLAKEGAGEVVVVGAERQTAGRGRQGRTWIAPPGRSLTFSLLLRPPVRPESLPLLPLLAGLALAEVAAGYCREVEVGLKWPNDLLLDGRKAAGVLVEGESGGAVVVGIGLNVDWRGVQRSDELLTAVSLAEVTDIPVDRWRLLAAIAGVFSQRYEVFKDLPAAFLDGYRARCLTLGRLVRVERVPGAQRAGAARADEELAGEDLTGEALVGEAVGVDGSGALEVRDAHGVLHRVSAGDVWHVRPAG